MKIVSNKPTITRKELEGVLDCLIHDDLSAGNTIKTFEGLVSAINGQKYSLAVSSLTSAYILIFKALELDSQSEIIIPSFFDSRSLSAIETVGAKPIPVDCEENSIFPSVDSIKEKITPNTKAIIVGHPFFFLFEIDKLSDIQIPIIEDISHVLGSEINAEPAGKNSTFTVISFSPSMIITTGNGGMVQTNNPKYFSVMRDLRGPDEDTVNLDCAMTDFQGAMGISQLHKLKEFLKRRREIASVYSTALKITSHKMLLPFSESFAYQSFPIFFNSTSEKIQKYWRKNGIQVVHSLPTPIHALLGYRGLDFPNSDRLSKKLYNIPIYPTLTKKEITSISKHLSSFI
jgi:dTDP-4-amino-4,6-dideoxygalactose transaminase